MNKKIVIGSIIGVSIVLISLVYLNKEFLASQFQRVTQSTDQIQGDVVKEEDILVPNKIISDSPAVQLTEKERDGLLRMREEEKLAHDVYSTLGNYWGQQIFSNISRSELTHTSAVKALLEKYTIPDPYVDGVGKFKSETMQNLYTTLTAQGKKSLTDALRVGTLVEDLDINDLNMLLAETSNADIKVVYGNLLRGSENHLRSFSRTLSNRGVTYTPEYISKELYESIIAASNSNGNRR